MSRESTEGFWKAVSENEDDDSIDFLWIGENGRMIHRIIYNHGGYVMRLWFKAGDGVGNYKVWLKPKSEMHDLQMNLEGDKLTVEHKVLNVEKTDFIRIEEADIPDAFAKDLKWGNKTMDTMEKKAK